MPSGLGIDWPYDSFFPQLNAGLGTAGPDQLLHGPANLTPPHGWPFDNTQHLHVRFSIPSLGGVTVPINLRKVGVHLSEYICHLSMCQGEEESPDCLYTNLGSSCGTLELVIDLHAARAEVYGPDGVSLGSVNLVLGGPDRVGAIILDGAATLDSVFLVDRGR